MNTDGRIAKDNRRMESRDFGWVLWSEGGCRGLRRQPKATRAQQVQRVSHSPRIFVAFHRIALRHNAIPDHGTLIPDADASFNLATAPIHIKNARP